MDICATLWIPIGTSVAYLNWYRTEKCCAVCESKPINSTVDPWTWWLGAPTPPCSRKSTWTFDSAKTSVVPWWSLRVPKSVDSHVHYIKWCRTICICGFPTGDWKYYFWSTVGWLRGWETQGYIGLILLFKNPHVSGPAQFKPLLLKGELYYEHRGTTWYLFKFSGVQGYWLYLTKTGQEHVLQDGTGDLE